MWRNSQSEMFITQSSFSGATAIELSENTFTLCSCCCCFFAIPQIDEFTTSSLDYLSSLLWRVIALFLLTIASISWAWTSVIFSYHTGGRWWALFVSFRIKSQVHTSSSIILRYREIVRIRFVNILTLKHVNLNPFPSKRFPIDE